MPIKVEMTIRLHTYACKGFVCRLLTPFNNGKSPMHSAKTRQHIAALVAACWALCAPSAHAASTDSECFLDWIESIAPSLLFPAHQPTQTVGNIFYRAYPSTGFYVGTDGTSALAVDTSVGPYLVNLGAMSDILPSARFANCGVPVAASRYSRVGSYPITDCVHDTTTGLIWEGKTTSGFRANSNTYTNYNNFGGASYTAAEINAATNSIGFANEVNTAGLCGFNTGWRLPTKDELLSLVNAAFVPTIDTNWFPNTQAANYWSSSPDSGYAYASWYVNFYNGGAFKNTHLPYRVQLVRTHAQ
jgi:hypothetical protein